MRQLQIDPSALPDLMGQGDYGAPRMTLTRGSKGSAEAVGVLMLNLYFMTDFARLLAAAPTMEYQGSWLTCLSHHTC